MGENKLYVMMYEDKITVLDRRKGNIDIQPTEFRFRYISEVPMDTDTVLIVSAGQKEVVMDIKYINSLLKRGVEILFIPAESGSRSNPFLVASSDESHIMINGKKGQFNQYNINTIIRIIEDERLLNIAREATRHVLLSAVLDKEWAPHRKISIGVRTEDTFDITVSNYLNANLGGMYDSKVKQISTKGVLETLRIVNKAISERYTVIVMADDEAIIIEKKEKKGKK